MKSQSALSTHQVQQVGQAEVTLEDSTESDPFRPEWAETTKQTISQEVEQLMYTPSEIKQKTRDQLQVLCRQKELVRSLRKSYQFVQLILKKQSTAITDEMPRGNVRLSLIHI